MRSGITSVVITLGIILTLSLSLQGCGRKGALKLPAHPVPAPGATTADPQKADIPSIHPSE